ncbi:DUF2744 domain-containing protein [Nocardia cyriacigeorgica]|uniref:phage gene 29 protein family protein n=1 Tax=Nocardia cyriacigeorgica TaxID=135487 RepID=UPI0018946E07|nr:DUF2744 domain-containing protein [Nocardia cyriacigeorgica]MBF6085229.1 DUF2744 domain-containing protein [Nocardia cyriacigeorgica]
MTTTDGHDKKAQIDALKATLTSVPGIGTGLGTVPPPLAERWATHQYDLGVRVHQELATKEYHDPFRGPRSAYNPAGSYKPLGKDKPKPTAIPRMADYTAQERAGVVAQLLELGDIPAPEPAADAAFVVAD